MEMAERGIIEKLEKVDSKTERKILSKIRRVLKPYYLDDSEIRLRKIKEGVVIEIILSLHSLEYSMLKDLEAIGISGMVISCGLVNNKLEILCFKGSE
ncbi:MAG: hypothetical protein QXG05_07960 [Nitrososphaerota archaeon]